MILIQCYYLVSFKEVLFDNFESMLPQKLDHWTLGLLQRFLTNAINAFVLKHSNIQEIGPETQFPFCDNSKYRSSKKTKKSCQSLFNICQGKTQFEKISKEKESYKIKVKTVFDFIIS